MSSFEIIIGSFSLIVIVAITIVYCFCYQPSVRYSEIEGSDDNEKERFVDKTLDNSIPIDLSKAKDSDKSVRLKNVKSMKELLSVESEPDEQL